MEVSHWTVAHCEPGRITSPIELYDAIPASDWLAIDLPGDVHQVLHGCGRLDDPHGDSGEVACVWVSHAQWWWRGGFEQAAVAKGERIVLHFDGLDTFATVWLNNVEIATSENMFLGVSVDVTAMVREGENEIVVRFDPVADRTAGIEVPSWPGVGGAVKENKRTAVRKAQFGWGWDWGPVQPTVGIWRPVRVERQRGAAIEELLFRTVRLRDDGGADVMIAAAVDRFDPRGDASVRFRIEAPDGSSVFERDLAVTGDGSQRVEETLTIPDAQLWWTADLGVQPLYRFSAEVAVDGQVVAERSLTTGIRTVALDTSPDPDEPGCDFFRFVLNGRPIFSKGACWIPAHSLVGLLTEDHYRPLIEGARDGGMNMLRVWGGGIYEHDAFYDLCDELGVLVWQDFMFACAPYPEEDPAFVASVRAEAAYQVRRLRHHPSIALWCGNNENQFIQDFVNEAVGEKLPLQGAKFYDHVIPEEVAANDPSLPYWPGSPSGGPHANSMRAGDLHNWTVWHGLQPVPDDKSIGGVDLSPAGVDYHRYAEDMGRFISEFGIQASPVLETLRRSVAPDQLTLGSASMQNRIKDKPKNKVDAIMEPVTGLPTTIEDYVDFTQITQAEGLKFGIEHFRRRKPHCSGTLIWQLNDCWPGVSWSVIDFYGFKKAGWHYVRRAYAPVLASFKPLDDGSVELWITNDRTEAVGGALTVALIDGDERWSETLAYRVADNGSEPVLTIPTARLAGGDGRVLTVRAADDAVPANRHFFAAIKDLPMFGKHTPDYSVEENNDGSLTVEIAAHCYLFFVHLLVPFETAQFSDNYFDLAAGETRRVTVSVPGRSLRAADLTVSHR